MLQSFLNQVIFIFTILIIFFGCKEATYQGELIPQHNKALNLYGYIDTLGNYIIPPKFSQVYQFEGDTTFAQKKVGYSHLVGFINRKGEWVYPPTIERFDFRDATRNTILVTLRKPTGHRVNAILKPNFEILELSEHVIPVPRYSKNLFYNNKNCQIAKNKSNKFGIIDTNRQWICLPEYDEIGNVGNKLIYAELGNKFGYIDSTGKVIIPFEYDVSRRNQPNNFPDSKKDNFVLKDGKYIIIDRKGNLVSSHKFDDYDINSTKHILKYKGKWGIFVNNDWLIPAEYDAIISYDFDDEKQTLINAIGVYKDEIVYFDKDNKREKKEFFNYHYKGSFGNRKIYISNLDVENSLDYTLHCKIDDSLHFYQSFPLITNTKDSISFKLQNNKVTFNIKGKFSEDFHEFRGVISDDSTTFSLVLNCIYKEKYEYYPKRLLTINRPIFLSNNPNIKKYEKQIYKDIQNQITKDDLFPIVSDKNVKENSYFELSTMKGDISVDINYISDKVISYTVRAIQWKNTYEELRNYIFQNGRLISFQLKDYLKPELDVEHYFYNNKIIYYQLEKDEENEFNFSFPLADFTTFHFSKNGLIVKFPYERYNSSNYLSKEYATPGNIMTYELLKPFIKTKTYHYLSNQKVYWEWYVEHERN